MVNLSEIKDLKTYLIQTYHAKRVSQQEEDQKYIDDTFPIPWLREGINRVKTGKAYRMVSSPAEHIITSNPQVFRDVQGKAKLQNERVTNELNRWASLLREYNPNPYKEHVRNLLARGEAWIYVVHNNGYRGDANEMPAQFIVPDPLIVYEDGLAGEFMGVPSRLVLCYERIAMDIKKNYPDWAWKNRGGKEDSSKVMYFMYWDKNVRYFEADDEPLLIESSDNGIQDNVYGFVPFVHAYSGFGKSSPDGDPASLTIGRITKCKDLISEYTSIRSTLNDLIYKYSHPAKDYYYNPSIGTPPVGFEENYSQEPGSFNKVPILGDIKEPIRKGVDMLPDVQLFQHLYNIEKDIDKEDPLSTAVLGTSGRQQDMAEESSLRRYETIVENSSQAFARAFGLALKMVEKFPHINPPNINKGDIGGYYDCRFELKAKDPLERDRLATLGDRLYNQGNGAIDLETYHTQYLNYTEENSKRIMAKMLVDKMTLYNPDVAQVMGMAFAEEAGLGKWIEEAQMKNAQMAEQQAALQEQPAATTQARVRGETKTPLGREMMDTALANRGARKPPERYTRG